MLSFTEVGLVICDLGRLELARMRTGCQRLPDVGEEMKTEEGGQEKYM